MFIALRRTPNQKLRRSEILSCKVGCRSYGAIVLFGMTDYKHLAPTELSADDFTLPDQLRARIPANSHLPVVSSFGLFRHVVRQTFACDHHRTADIAGELHVSLADYSET